MLTIAVSTALAAFSAPRWPDADWRRFERAVRSAVAQGADTLPLGQAIIVVARGFVGSPYAAGTLDPPGRERLVVNLRVFDCVTLVEHVLAITRFVRSEGEAGLAVRAHAERSYESSLQELRYRNGVIDGYASRLHYFTDWLNGGVAAGRLRLETGALGGDTETAPIDFMTRHRTRYAGLADSASLAALEAVEARLSRTPRIVLPKAKVAALADRIEEGDLVAAASAIRGLDVAHVGFAVRVDGALHLLHAPLTGKPVEISAMPLAERLQGISAQRGIMVARPLPAWFATAPVVQSAAKQ